MKIFVKKDLLQEQLQKTFISNIKVNIPVLHNILIEAKGGYLTTISTDLNIHTKYRQKIDIEREGAILLPGKKLIEIINNLEDNITIETDELKAEIREKNAIFHLAGMSPLEFPTFPEIKYKEVFNINSNLLQDMIKGVIFSASSDETFIPYCGIYLECENNKIKMVTSDRYRLSIVEKTYNPPFIDHSINIIIPIRSVYEIIKILRGIDCDIKVCISDKEIGIETENIIFISRLLDGKFPDYNKIIPKEVKEVVVDKDRFYTVLRRVSLMRKKEDNPVRFNVLKDRFILSVESELGDAKEEIDIEYKGDEFSLLFNPRYIFDCLRNISSDKIIFSVSSNIDKGIIKIPDCLYIIMPLRE